MASPNLFALATDGNINRLIPILRANPTLASSQDSHGYSLVHAATSYGHVDLLRALINEFQVDVNLKDEDDEPALFQAEEVTIARALIEELGADSTLRNTDGLTAAEAIEADGDRPLVSAYLREVESKSSVRINGETIDTSAVPGSRSVATSNTPALPASMAVNVATMEESPASLGEGVDPEIRRRIEELATRADFEGEEGQAELKRLITEIVQGQVLGGGEAREVRRRTD